MTTDLPIDRAFSGCTLSDTVNKRIDGYLQGKNATVPKRGYLGASRLGMPCSRALQYEYANTLPDQPHSGKTLRIFEIGHALEEMARVWLVGAGFDIAMVDKEGKPLGFSVASGQIQGHVEEKSRD